MITLHLAWHPYWNQLWGLAVMPYVLLLGWQALERLDGKCGGAREAGPGRVSPEHRIERFD